MPGADDYRYDNNNTTTTTNVNVEAKIVVFVEFLLKSQRPDARIQCVGGFTISIMYRYFYVYGWGWEKNKTNQIKPKRIPFGVLIFMYFISIFFFFFYCLFVTGRRRGRRWRRRRRRSVQTVHDCAAETPAACIYTSGEVSARFFFRAPEILVFLFLSFLFPYPRPHHYCPLAIYRAACARRLRPI